jgi:hypothetical protein
VGFQPAGNNHINGHVVLKQLRDGGIAIKVIAIGLKPGHGYVSHYYHNAHRALAPYSEHEQIGGVYTARNTGVGRTSGNADGNFVDIHSVFVWDAGRSELLACPVVSSDEA